MVGFLVGEALRDLRRAGPRRGQRGRADHAVARRGRRLLLLSANLGTAVAAWRDRAARHRLSQAASRRRPRRRARRTRGRPCRASATVRYVSRAEALDVAQAGARARTRRGRAASPANPLPASIEVTPSRRRRHARGRARARRAARRRCRRPRTSRAAWSGSNARATGSASSRSSASASAACSAVAAILTVTTATTLVLHARRYETEIMRLVGAPEFTIRLPLLLQGMVQGLLGAALALVGARGRRTRFAGAAARAADDRRRSA